MKTFSIALGTLSAWALGFSFLLAPVILPGCSGDKSVAPGDTAREDSLPAVSRCSAEATQHFDEGADHANPCSQVAYNTLPPTSGTHYSIWAAYKTYAAPVPDGFLVHDLEHGALVIGYNCPAGCAEEVAVVQAWIDRLPGDPLCGGGRPKIILAPNPALDTRWAAAAWSWSWKAPCPNTAALREFYDAHYGKTVEAGVCGGGSDLSASGWCPAGP